MNNFKPIETRYRGYRARSRTEARYMVYFDSAGIRFEYEPEGFEFSDGSRYLPDFWLPDYSMWAEVKPTQPNSAEISKAVELVRCSRRECLMLIGQPAPNPYPIIGLDHGPNGEVGDPETYPGRENEQALWTVYAAAEALKSMLAEQRDRAEFPQGGP